MIHIIVLLEARDLDYLTQFEVQALQIMKKYKGKLITAFRPDPQESSPTPWGEVHILQFSDVEAFHAYRADEQLAALGSLRVQAIANTSILVSGELIDYG